MNNTSKITLGIATGGLMLSAFATSAFAGYEGSHNGYRSDNNYRFNYENRTDINQRNNANIDNNVNVYSNTGNNRSNRNVGGSSWINTGDSRSSVSINNQANSNYANVGGSSYDSNGYKDGNNKHGGHNNHNGYKDDKHSGKDNHDNNYYPHDHYKMAWLSGEEEVPGPGDTDGKGKAKIHVDPEADNVCAMVKVKNIETASAAHIHHGEKGVAGPVVVTLPTPDENGYAEGCVTVSDELANNILEDPDNYYVNVHNEDFPDGAVRGQLHSSM